MTNRLWYQRPFQKKAPRRAQVVISQGSKSSLDGKNPRIEKYRPKMTESEQPRAHLVLFGDGIITDYLTIRAVAQMLAFLAIQ